MVNTQGNTQKSVENVQPVPSVMYVQGAVLQNNNIMAHAVDECSQVYNWCRESGHYGWLACVGVLAECRLNPAQE